MTSATVPSGANPATIVIDPTGHFAYAGNFGANARTPPAGPSTISQYLVSQTDGSLTPMNGAAATAPSGSGPVAIAIHPNSKYLYVANLGDNNIGQYSINTDGTLTPLATATVPTGLVNSGTSPVGIAIDYQGRYVYVANQGDGTVSQYAVGTDGSLSAIAAAVTTGEPGTSSVTVDPTGQFVYATNRGGTTIAQFTIGGNGALTPATTATVPAGMHPTSIATGY
jgi:6-phosphogluconolactonase (cycloisomerase 2 family)